MVMLAVPTALNSVPLGAFGGLGFPWVPFGFRWFVKSTDTWSRVYARALAVLLDVGG